MVENYTGYVRSCSSSSSSFASSSSCEAGGVDGGYNVPASYIQQGTSSLSNDVCGHGGWEAIRCGRFKEAIFSKVVSMVPTLSSSPSYLLMILMMISLALIIVISICMMMSYFRIAVKQRRIINCYCLLAISRIHSRCSSIWSMVTYRIDSYQEEDDEVDRTDRLHVVEIKGTASSTSTSTSTSTSMREAAVSHQCGASAAGAGEDVVIITAKEEEERQLRKGAIPRHIAVIMDGNRRYGMAKYGDPLKGHADGGKRLGEFLEWCQDLGVAMVTAYAFSTENWKRDPIEVNMLMELIRQNTNELREEAKKKNVRIRVLATDAEQLPSDVREAVRIAQQETAACDGFTLNICLSYGGRQELLGAMKAIARDVKNGQVEVEDIDEIYLADRLLTGGLPDPDLLIRTSGETRISNFLLFQLAYTELFFSTKLWPELTKADLCDIIKHYQLRNRRYGC